MTSSVRRLRSVADEGKGRTKSREASRSKPLTDNEELKDDAFKSCNGSSHGGDNVVVAVPDTSVITVNRTWWAPPKSAALLQPRTDDPLAKAEKMALNLRASKKQEILASKRTRGISKHSGSSSLHEGTSH